jgi:hypothetical protein
MLLLKINVTKVDKARLFEGKNGAKYLDLVVTELEEPDQFGNTMLIKQACSKEERQSGVKMPIIGNGKELTGSKPKPQAPKPTAAATTGDDDGLPF